MMSNRSYFSWRHRRHNFFTNIASHVVKLSILFAVLLTCRALQASDNKFWWGIATSPYQTEDPAGSDFKTDWDLFFEAGKLKEARGSGVFSYSEVDRDIRALKELGVSHYRFGVEWARIEPSPGVYDELALDHYLKLARKLKSAGIEPVVCLWHFTFPAWLANLSDPERSNWLHPETSAHWKLYVEKVVKLFGDQVRFYAPENEPNGQSLAGYFLGSFPPGEKYSLSLFRKSVEASAEAFNSAADIIHTLNPAAKVITIQNMIAWERPWWDITGYMMDLGHEYNYSHLDLVAKKADWIGFNYYYKLKVSPFPNPRKTHPEGMEVLIAELSARYKKPVIIMENGIADHGDEERQAYLTSHLAALERARKAGHDIRGYFYWSLIDNFEWAYGYSEKFGLYSLGSRRDQLIPKKSAELFAEAIRKDRTQQDASQKN